MEGLIFYIIGILGLIIVAKLLVLPFKIVVKLVWNGIIGGLLLLVFNTIGASFDLYIPVTALTASLVGFLGVPGIVILVIYKLIG